MATTVEIKSKPTSPTVWLEVTYSGLEPPISLFDDLAMVGWTPPAIPPPPASAIDWSTPDPATGQRFTIADYLVERAVVEPPRGSGPLGRWTDADRRAHFAVLEGVLARHGLLEQVRDGVRRSGRAPAAPPSPAPAAAHPAAAPPAPPVATAPAASTGSPPGDVPPGAVRITAPISPASQAAMATALANAGVRKLTFAPVHRTIVHRYRGAENAQQVLDHLRLEVLVDPGEAEAVKGTITATAAAAGEGTVAIDVEEGPPAAEEAPGPPALHAVSTPSAVRSA